MALSPVAWALTGEAAKGTSQVQPAVMTRGCYPVLPLESIVYAKLKGGLTMRGFIQLCGALFVIAGIVGFVIAVLAVITFPAGILAGLAVVFGAAGVTLIGGTAYMLCSIDQRLETANQRNTGS